MSDPKEPNQTREDLGKFDADRLPDYHALMKLTKPELEALTPEQRQIILYPPLDHNGKESKE